MISLMIFASGAGVYASRLRVRCPVPVCTSLNRILNAASPEIATFRIPRMSTAGSDFLLQLRPIARLSPASCSSLVVQFVPVVSPSSRCSSRCERVALDVRLDVRALAPGGRSHGSWFARGCGARSRERGQARRAGQVVEKRRSPPSYSVMWRFWVTESRLPARKGWGGCHARPECRIRLGVASLRLVGGAGRLPLLSGVLAAATE
ncbi:uncharacterized protein BO97DRAFT_21298 [Aspergillus homomorphus CBS 101889]|uniref:Uncharacterized protein n=1 Tax=Aspergillus homomorphus (strain CBS 101889) TaxID=1450537 RepID=A0A395I2G7_ASPHC|nr:hypothetical protein BO97DRAFT_21298 [Aspergillus homomorphus CBS 101889]RAL14137.1 hypothetical protein BO97DRAFT_21298 [Aspergillus homomorphus CBS 101889]